MTAANEQQMGHADRHDRDKLARWKADLDGSADAGIPYCAIFLVGPEHRASHDIFRRYRSAFEELGGGFHNLVIFGQHGVSTTQTAFLKELEMQQGSVPVLAIAAVSPDAEAVPCIELPPGDYDGELDDSQAWGVALERISHAALGQSPLSFDAIEGAASGGFSRGSLADTVAGVLTGLGGDI